MASKSRPPRAIAAALAETYRAFPELKKLPAAASETAFTISNLPELRPLELRKGAQLGNALKNMAKPFNLEVCLAYMRGELVKPCYHCVKLSGPHLNCVVLAGFFDGSCTSCQYNNNGSKCPLRGRKPQPIVNDTDIYPEDDDLYVPDEDSDTPPVNASVTLVQDSGHPRIPSGASLAKRIGHDARVEFGIRGAANLPRINATQQNPPQESGYDGRQYENDFLTSRPSGQSSRDVALERIANAYHHPLSNRAREHERRELLYRDDRYDVRPSDHLSTLSNRDFRDSLPLSRENYRRGRSHSPPPLINRIEQRHQPFRQSYGYENDPNRYGHDPNRFSPRDHRNEEFACRDYEYREDHYSPPRNSRTEREFVRETRMTENREPEEYAPLDRRITPKPRPSAGNDERRRDGLNPSWPEIDPPQKPQTLIAGKRDSTTAFGSNESMPPSKKKVQFAPVTSSGATTGAMPTPSANPASNGVPTEPRSMVNTNHSGVPTGHRVANSAGESSSKGPSVSLNENGNGFHSQAPPTAPQQPQTSRQNSIILKDKQSILPPPSTASVSSARGHNTSNSTQSNIESTGNKPSHATTSDQEVPFEIVATLAPSSKDHVIAHTNDVNLRSMAMRNHLGDSDSIVANHPQSTEASAVEQIPQFDRLRVSGSLDKGEGETVNAAKRRKETPPENSQAISSKSVAGDMPQQPNKIQPTEKTVARPLPTSKVQEPPKKRKKTPPIPRPASTIVEMPIANLQNNKVSKEGPVSNIAEPVKKQMTPTSDLANGSGIHSLPKKPKTITPINSPTTKRAEIVSEKPAPGAGTVTGEQSRSQTKSPSVETSTMRTTVTETVNAPKKHRNTLPTGIQPAKNTQGLSGMSGTLSTTIETAFRKPDNPSPIIQPNESRPTKARAPTERRRKTPMADTSRPNTQKSTGKQSEKIGSVTSENLLVHQKDSGTGIPMAASTDSYSKKSSGTTLPTEIKQPVRNQKKTPSERSADNATMPTKLLRKRPIPINVGSDANSIEVVFGMSTEKNTPVAANPPEVQKKDTPPVQTAIFISESGAEDTARMPSEKPAQQSTSTQTEPVIETLPIFLKSATPPPLSETSISIQTQTAASQRLPFDERHHILLDEAMNMTHAQRETALGDLAFRTSVFHEANSRALQR